MCSLEKKGNIYILTLTDPGEHRLNPDLIDSIRSALSTLKSHPPSSPPSILITTNHGKFFSNGFDLSWAQSFSPRLKLMSSKFQLLVSDLISLPMPTIAAVTGHAAAAGMILALTHDYVVMRKDRGFMYMSEVDIGLVIPQWFVVLLEIKIGRGKVLREVVMGAEKLTAEMAVERRIVGSVGEGAEGTVDAAVELGERILKRRWDGGAFAKNRMVVLRDVLKAIEQEQSMEEKASQTSSRL
ncbi:unnamed protein product [Linum trigynum]|uniref:Delta(3)-Delta(2)-enoyl-CoA isomerase n=1 Tax=Linum trigynum TaxID=586398 RepID=A0AAV2EN02_9ROSI